MINEIQLKVCGLTSVRDAEAAARAGADYLGFNLYPKSPRYIPLAQYLALASGLPATKRVAVMVEPADAELARATQAGFDFFQIHFRSDLPPDRPAAWSKLAGKDRLFLAPKLPPSAAVAPAWLPLAEFIMLDTFDPEIFGGTGRTGDWAKFSRIREAHPATRWILSGGLTPGNVVAAVRQSGARFVDVNSGVESAPGVKDPAKLTVLASALKTA